MEPLLLKILGDSVFAAAFVFLLVYRNKADREREQELRDDLRSAHHVIVEMATTKGRCRYDREDQQP